MRLFFILLVLLIPLKGKAEPVLIREDFKNLTKWATQTFKKIHEHSKYDVEVDKENTTFLRAQSEGSASGLVLKETFNVKKYPVLRWRWKVSNVYPKGDASRKKGDDYPIRVYVVFPYEPDKASFTMRMKYKAAKLLRGEYPPHSSLLYIWANKIRSEKFLPNAYTERAMMFPVDQGAEFVGQWREHERNILNDYRLAFGEDPPDTASLAIMNDSDNTKSRSLSFVDYVEIAAK